MYEASSDTKDICEFGFTWEKILLQYIQIVNSYIFINFLFG